MPYSILIPKAFLLFFDCPTFLPYLCLEDLFYQETKNDFNNGKNLDVF